MRNKPRIRFKGFTEDWEQRKLGDIATFSKGNGYSKSDLGSSGDPIILYGRLYTNYETTISNVDTFVELKDKSIISQGGEVIVPAPGETAEDISRASVVKNQGIIIGGDLNVIKANYLLDPTFLALTISNGEQQKELSKRAQGKSVVHLHNSDLQEVNLTFPLLNEQKEISTLFEKMDNIITLHQRKLEKLKLAKKALLQKLFPKNGSKFPELRFKGFADAWEQRKLGDVTNIKTGSRNQQDSVANGKYPFFIRSEKIEKLDEYDFDTEAILVPGDGRIGEIFHYYNGKFALHQRVYKVDDFKGVDAIYLLYLFQCKFKEHALRLNAQGTVPSLRLPMFTEWNIDIPSLQEQICIGRLLNKIELMITLHQRKLDKLQDVKKGLLQKMFV